MFNEIKYNFLFYICEFKVKKCAARSSRAITSLFLSGGSIKTFALQLHADYFFLFNVEIIESCVGKLAMQRHVT